MVWLRQDVMKDESLRHACRDETKLLAPLSVHEQLFPDGNSTLLGGLLKAFGTSLPPLYLLAIMPVKALQSLTTLTHAAACHLALDDLDRNDDIEYERAWRSFWKLATLFQFSPVFTMASTKGVRENLYVTRSVDSESVGETQVTDQTWQEIALISLFGKQVLALAEAGVPEPEVGYELSADNGEVLADAIELAWPGAKTGIAEEKDMERDRIYTSRGWIIYVGIDDNVISQLKHRLGEAKEA